MRQCSRFLPGDDTRHPTPSSSTFEEEILNVDVVFLNKVFIQKQNAPGGGDEYVCRQARVRKSILSVSAGRCDRFRDRQAQEVLRDVGRETVDDHHVLGVVVRHEIHELAAKQIPLDRCVVDHDLDAVYVPVMGAVLMIDLDQPPEAVQELQEPQIQVLFHRCGAETSPGTGDHCLVGSQQLLERVDLQVTAPLLQRRKLFFVLSKPVTVRFDVRAHVVREGDPALDGGPIPGFVSPQVSMLVPEPASTRLLIELAGKGFPRELVEPLAAVDPVRLRAEPHRGVEKIIELHPERGVVHPELLEVTVERGDRGVLALARLAELGLPAIHVGLEVGNGLVVATDNRNRETEKGEKPENDNPRHVELLCNPSKRQLQRIGTFWQAGFIRQNCQNSSHHPTTYCSCP